MPWGSNQPLPAFRASTVPALPVPKVAISTVGDKGDDGPPPGEPLCLWEEPENAAVEGGGRGVASTLATTSSSPRARIMVDPMLTRWLRPHQREGVAFMFECVTGIKVRSGSKLLENTWSSR